MNLASQIRYSYWRVLGLSNRAAKALAKDEISNLEYLATLDVRRMLYIEGIGRSTVRELISVLERNGFPSPSLAKLPSDLVAWLKQ